MAGLEWPGPLFPFQHEGVRRLLASPSVLLADEMGLGKTVQAIAALRLLLRDSPGGRCLVVCPAGLVLQWRRMLRLWAPEVVRSTVRGTPEERQTAWRADAGVYLVSYETLRADAMVRATWGPARRRWLVCVLDEAQRIKNPKSEAAHAAKRLDRERSWALTGTPLENRLDDLLSILDFVAPGRFRKEEMAVGLRRLLADVQLRRRRSDVLADLPPKTVATVDLDLTERQRATYRRAHEQGLVRLATLGGDVRVTHVLELILRLKQICNFCPESGASAKLDHLRRQVAAAVAAGRKTLVFTQFVEPPFGARQLAAELAAFAPLLLSGDQDAATRDATVQKFMQESASRLLILSLRAGGVGLNLTAATRVVHFDRWWNPALEMQAEDRAHRIGQTSPVQVEAYLCRDTIEERIDEILWEKRTLFADVIDGVDIRRLERLDLNALIAAYRGAA